MKSTLTISCLFLIPWMLSGQGLDSLLKQLDNSPAAIAGAKRLEAERMNAKLGIAPGNPEATYAYLIGSPSGIGTQQEIEIMQNFRLPSYYKARREYQQSEYRIAEVQVAGDQFQAMVEIGKLYCEIVHLKKLRELLMARNQESDSLLILSIRMLESGEISKSAFESFRFMHMVNQNELKATQNELIARSARLNLLIGYEYSGTFEYPAQWQLPPRDMFISNAMERDIDLDYALLLTENSASRLNLTKQERYPELAAGYKSERILAENLDGFQVGLSIPVWQGRKQVEHARIRQEYAAINYNQTKQRMTSELEIEYESLEHYRNSYLQMDSVLQMGISRTSAAEMLSKGEYSMAEYYMESSLFHAFMKEYLEMERDYFERLVMMKIRIDF